MYKYIVEIYPKKATVQWRNNIYEAVLLDNGNWQANFKSKGKLAYYSKYEAISALIKYINTGRKYAY